MFTEIAGVPAPLSDDAGREPEQRVTIAPLTVTASPRQRMERGGTECPSPLWHIHDDPWEADGMGSGVWAVKEHGPNALTAHESIEAVRVRLRDDWAVVEPPIAFSYDVLDLAMLGMRPASSEARAGLTAILGAAAVGEPEAFGATVEAQLRSLLDAA